MIEPPDAAVSQDTPEPAASRGRVLVVDDEVELLTALRDLLAAQGYETTGTPSGTAALEILRGQDMDLLLADLMMPEMDGATLLRAAREIDPHLVGIIMTGYGTVQTAVEAMKAGAYDYVLKPFKLDALLPVLSRAMELRRLRKETVQLRETLTTYELSKAVAFTLEPNVILGKIADAALDQCEADEVSIMLPTIDGRELYVAVVRGDQRGQILSTRVPIEEGIAGWVARHREPLILEGEVQDPRFAPLHPRTDIRSAISMPLQVGNRLVGVLNVNATRARRPFTQGQVKALSILGTTAAAALEAAWLFEQVRTAEAHFRTLIEHSSDLILTATLEGTVTYAGPSAARILGYAPEEIAGRSVTDLVHPEDLPRALSVLADTALEPGTARSVEVRVATRDGSWRLLEAVGKVVQTPSGEAIAVVNARDLTERKAAEEQIKQQLEVLTALYASARDLSQSRDLAELADYMVTTADAVFGVRAASVVRVDPDGSTHGLAHYPPDAAHLPVPSFYGHDAHTGESMSERAIRTAAPVIIDDVDKDPKIRREHAAALRNSGVHAVASFPLVSRATPFGALTLYSDRPGFFAPALVEFIATLTNHVAAAMASVRLYEEAGRRLDHLQTLRDIETAISGSLDIDVILSILLDKTTTQLRVDAADVLLFDQPSQTLHFAAERGFRTQALRRTRLRLGQGYAGQAALDRRTITVPNLEANPGAFTRSPLLPEERFATYFAAPLLAKGQIKGVLEIFHRTRISPDREWLDFLSTLAGQAAVAIDSVETFDRLQRANVDLMLAYDTTLEGWVRALDLRDEETEGHTQRVTELTVRLARAMGFSEAELVHVRRGALLHDIGKMGVPDSILLKTGSLSAEEMAIMRKHTVYAYELLSPIAYLRPAIDIPYCHHERWDGTGYPRGLKGTEIPLAARIFAVADVWDALRSDRPYRLAWPEEKVRSYIQEQAGTHFEPRIVEAFLQLEELPQVTHLTIRSEARATS